MKSYTKRHLLTCFAITFATVSCTSVAQTTNQNLPQSFAQPSPQVMNESNMTGGVIVIVRIHAKSGMEENLKQELLNVVALSRGEPDCIFYDLHQSVDNKQLFVLHQNWENREALERHFQTEEYQRMTKVTENMLFAPTEILMVESHQPTQY